jgi:hypothetical protein
MAGFLSRLSESWSTAVAISGGKAGRLVFAVCATAEKYETTVINRSDAVLFIVDLEFKNPAQI